MLSLGLQISCVVLVPADWSVSTDDTSTSRSEPPPYVTISELQRGEVTPSEHVRLVGVTTHNHLSEGVYLHDGTSGEWSGVWITPDAGGLELYEQGDLMQAIGVYDEVRGLTTVTLNAPADLEWGGESWPDSTPTLLLSSGLEDNLYMEPYESTLVRVENLVVTQVNSETGVFEVQEAAGLGTETLIIDTQLFSLPKVSTEDTFEQIVGVLTWMDDHWRLEPRGSEDFYRQNHPADPADFSIKSLIPGEIILTEIMLMPEDCPGIDCAWLEILNLASGSVDLEGLSLRNSDEESFPINESVVIPVDSYALISFGTESNWGLPLVTPVLYMEDQVSFKEDQMTLTLRVEDTDTDLDKASWTASEISSGFSRQLDNTHLDASSNDNPESWCDATSAIDGTKDRGTPGQNNDSCLSQ